MKITVVASLLVSVAATLPPYEAFLNGMLQAIEPAVKGQVAPCITDSDGGMDDVRTGISDIIAGITTGNVTALVDAVLDFEGALSDLEQAASDCNAAQLATDLGTLLADLESDPIGTLAKLIPYYPQVLGDLTNAVNDFASQNYTGAGYDVGDVFSILLENAIKSILAKPVRKVTEKQTYEDFLNGLLSVLAPTVNATVASCINTTDAGYVSTQTAFQLIAEGIQDRNYTEIMQALPYFTTALGELRAAAAACGEPQLANELAQLISSLQSDPFGTLAKLLPHWSDVLGDLTGAVSAWTGGDLNTAGQDLGQVLALLLNPTAYKGRVSRMRLFMDSLVRAH